MTSETFAARVARGAALLDEKFPGWVDQIDLDQLDLRSACSCILGQKFSDFGGGAEALGYSANYAPGQAWDWNYRGEALQLHDLGFFEKYEADEMTRSGIPQPGGFYRVQRNYGFLTEAWKTYIINRRAAEQLAELSEPELVNA